MQDFFKHQKFSSDVKEQLVRFLCKQINLENGISEQFQQYVLGLESITYQAKDLKQEPVPPLILS